MTHPINIFEDPRDRIRRLMPKSHDPVILVIKGHLLLEEAMFAVIKTICRRPEALENARLSFLQLLSLFSGLTGINAENTLYKFIKGTNELRNKLAHNAEVPDLEKKIEALLAVHAREGFKSSKNARERAVQLRTVFAFTCGLVYGTGHGISVASTKD